MIKLGTSNGNILVSVSQSEFKSLTGKVPSNVVDNTEASIESTLNKIKLVDAKLTELKAIKEEGQSLINKLTAIGV